MSAMADARCWLVAAAALAGGCNLPGVPNKADRPIPANQVMDFNVLYAAHCAGCHGADGKLGPAPPLNDAIFFAIVPDAELLRVVREGRNVHPAQKTPMPGFGQNLGGPLTDAQVKALAEGIKKRWQNSTIGPKERSSLPAYFADKTAGGGNKDEGIRVFARPALAAMAMTERARRMGSRCARARYTIRRSWRLLVIRNCGVSSSAVERILECRPM